MKQIYPTYKIPYLVIVIFCALILLGIDYILTNSNFSTFLFEAYLRSKIIYILEIGVFLFGTCLIIYLGYKIHKENIVLEKLKMNLNSFDKINPQNIQSVINQISDDKTIYQESLSYYRTKLNLNLYVSTKSVTETVEDDERFSEIMEKDLESNFEYIRYCIWVIPIFGFIGTLWGITKAVFGFSSILNSVEVGSESKILLNSLESISLDLSTAFETTLPALIISALLAFFLALLDRNTDKLILKLDKFQIDNVIRKLQTNISDITAGISANSNGGGNSIELLRAVTQILTGLQENITELNNHFIRMEENNQNLSTIIEENAIDSKLLREVLDKLVAKGIPLSLSVKD